MSNFWFVILITVLLVLLIAPVIYFVYQNDIKSNLLTEQAFVRLRAELAERCYFEGQQDALNGDIRIKFVSTSEWIWVRSPWDDGTLPVFGKMEGKLEKE